VWASCDCYDTYSIYDFLRDEIEANNIDAFRSKWFYPDNRALQPITPAGTVQFRKSLRPNQRAQLWAGRRKRDPGELQAS
jgi:hypothetical protein